MLSLSIQANDYAELKQKTFEALGITASQLTLPLTSTPSESLDEPKAEPKAEKPKAAKASKKAAPKVEPIEPVVTEESEEVIAGPTMDDCKEALKKVMRSPNQGMGPAAELLKEFGVGLVTNLKPEQYQDFINRCVETVS